MIATHIPASGSLAPKQFLIIDDDVQLCHLMKDYFGQFSFQLNMAHDGQSGLSKALEEDVELVLLDVMIPKMDGIEVLRQLRKRSYIPVIMLTARTLEADRIVGLDAGADDYLPKPFSPGELMARVRAVLRRSSHFFGCGSSVFEQSGVRIDGQTRQVWRGLDEVEVTGVEFDVLDYLIRATGRIVTRDELSIMLYQRPSTRFERAIDVHISHLRRKLERGDRPLIQMVRGLGYRFVFYEGQ